MMAIAVASTHTDRSNMAAATAAVPLSATISRYTAIKIAAIGRLVSPSITGSIWRDIVAWSLSPLVSYMPEAGTVSKHWDERYGQVWGKRPFPLVEAGKRPELPPLRPPLSVRWPQETEARIFGILSEKISSIWFSLMISGGESAMVSAVMRISMPTSWKPFSIAL